MPRIHTIHSKHTKQSSHHSIYNVKFQFYLSSLYTGRVKWTKISVNQNGTQKRILIFDKSSELNRISVNKFSRNTSTCHRYSLDLSCWKKFVLICRSVDRVLGGLLDFAGNLRRIALKWIAMWNWCQRCADFCDFRKKIENFFF